MRMVVPTVGQIDNPTRQDSSLLKALGRAIVWRDKLESGEVASINAIARDEKMTGRYVSRILQLAYLSPEIVESILAGTQPPDFTVERLRGSIPISWQDQCRLFGFCS